MHAARSSRLLEWLVAAAAAAALLFASDLLVPPAPAPFMGHGQRYADMVAHPFAFTGDFPHRVLWPLLAHVAGWFGVTPVDCTAVTSGALLAVVFWFARRRQAPWPDALLVTAAVAATGAVQVYKPMACMSADTLVLLSLLLAVHHVARPAWCWGLVAVATFSHELALFFAPWLAWLRLCHGGTWRTEAIGLAACTGLHLAWRSGIGLFGQTAYDASYYTGNAFWVPFGMPSMWALWALVALAEFGPLLAVAVWGFRRGEHGLGGRLGPWLFLGCTLSLMVFAYDVMRFTTFLAIPVLLAALAMLRARRGRIVFALLLVAAIGSYAYEHPVPSQQGGATFTAVSSDVLRLLPPEVLHRIVEQKARLSAAEGAAHFTALLRERPALWAGAFGVAVAIAALGVWLARYVGTTSAAGSAPRTRANASP